MGLRGLEVFIHRDFSARSGIESRRLQIHQVGICLASHCVQKGVTMNAFATLQVRDHAAPIVAIHRRHLLAQSENGPVTPHVVAEGFHDFLVDKLEQRRPLLDERDLDPQRRQHGSKLQADHATANDDHLPRDLLHLEKLVAG